MKKLLFLLMLISSSVYSQDTLSIDTVKLGEVTIHINFQILI
jgi:hypothetical protein